MHQALSGACCHFLIERRESDAAIAVIEMPVDAMLL